MNSLVMCAGQSGSASAEEALPAHQERRLATGPVLSVEDRFPMKSPFGEHPAAAYV